MYKALIAVDLGKTIFASAFFRGQTVKLSPFLLSVRQILGLERFLGKGPPKYRFTYA